MRQTSSSRILFSSGGSTGTPKFTELTFDEVLTNSAIHGKGYAACGIGANDVVATWGLAGVMNSEFTVYLALSITGCMVLPIGEVGGAEGIYNLLVNFRPTVLLVMPSDLAVLARYMEEKSVSLPGVRLIVTGGEPLYPSDQHKFRNFFGEFVDFKSVFQTSDTGTIGYQCKYLSGQQYHIHDDLQTVRIENPDASGIGDLITTNHSRRLTPVTSAPTGDRARKLDGECLCGRKTTRIELAGRCGQFVKVGGEKFDLNWLSHIRDLLGVAIDDFQVRLTRNAEGLDGIQLFSNQVIEDQELQLKACALFSDLSAKIAQQLREGVIRPLGFAPLNASDLMIGASGKFKFFQDTRKI